MPLGHWSRGSTSSSAHRRCSRAFATTAGSSAIPGDSPVHTMQRPHGRGSGSSSCRRRNAIRHSSVRPYVSIAACSARRASVTRRTRSSSYVHGESVRSHLLPARSTAPSTSRIFNMFFSRIGRTLTAARISFSLTGAARSSSNDDDLLGARARGEGRADEVVLDVAVLRPAQQHHRRVRQRATGASDLLVVGDRRGRRSGSGSRSRGPACRTPSRAPRSRPAPSPCCR